MERDTVQRRAIRAAIEQADRPLSPQEVLEMAQTDVPKLGIATVYRTLKGLVAEDWLQPVSLPGEAPRYERADKHHHHHFHCRHCGRAYDIEGCPQNLQDMLPEDFQLEDHDVTLYGQCAACTHGEPPS